MAVDGVSVESSGNGTAPAVERARATRGLAAGLARAFGGALVFGLPMLMTMEFWHLGFAMDRLRLALLLALSVPLLTGVAHRVGFEPTFGWREDLRDAFIALGVGALASAAILVVLNVANPGMPVREQVGKVAVQAVPAALGALLARSQFGHQPSRAERRGDGRAFGGHAGAFFMMLVGALFLSLNTAPTEEMILISYLMTPWHAVALAGLSIALMHGFVFAAGFRGGVAADPGIRRGSRFVRVTLVGYALALAVSLYVLWTFGRTDAVAGPQVLMATVVLGFPAAVGAAAARLIL
jgi:putative integral membrane protein (TIGR02587 family)